MGTVHIDREYWVDMLVKVADPVLNALAERKLKETMPIEQGHLDRTDCTHLEALGRLLAGMAPWLEHGSPDGEEGRLRTLYAEKARQAIDAGTDPESPDFMNFTTGFQRLVDAAFLAHGILRAPTQLWDLLEERVKANVIHCLKQTRGMKPGINNWLCFSGMVEVALRHMGEQWDHLRIDHVLKQLDQFYFGDGIYGDGLEIHVDYYNSYVIQPMLVDILKQVTGIWPDWDEMKEKVIRRAERYAIIQERTIAPDGTFPVIGRSIAYRGAAFQHLAQMALQHHLPALLKPNQVRCALTAVIRRTLEPAETFDEAGWLRLGLAGHQPGVAEAYVSTGSLYLCSTIFLPLGLPSSDPFWHGEAEWTSQLAWSGRPIAIDQFVGRG